MKKKKDHQTFLGSKRKGTYPCLACSHCNNVIKGENIYYPKKGSKIPITPLVTPKM